MIKYAFSWRKPKDLAAEETTIVDLQGKANEK